MVTSEVLAGSGMGASGLAFYGYACWYVRDDGRLRRMAQSRWWWDRRTMPKLRTGEMSQEEWFDRFARGQRQIVKWAFTPFFVLWLGLAVATIVHGLVTD